MTMVLYSSVLWEPDHSTLHLLAGDTCGKLPVSDLLCDLTSSNKPATILPYCLHLALSYSYPYPAGKIIVIASTSVRHSVVLL